LKNPTTAYFFFLVALACALLLNGCAQMIPLGGGQKDEIPPKVVDQSPQNKALNFSGDEVIVEFDEYIQLRDVQNQLIITPRLKEDPDVSVKGKTLKLKFRQPLQANTTYNINFGASVSDVHEGNVFQGLAIIFSTGGALDSLTVSGKVVNALTLKPQADVSVFIYGNAKDSFMFNSKPDYFGRADKSGNYLIQYIKAGKYKMIAFEDKNRNFIYDQPEELVSNFHEIEIKSAIKSDFEVFKEKTSRFFVKRTTYPAFGKVIYLLSRQPEKPMLVLKAADKDRVAWFFSADTLKVFYRNDLKDTIPMFLGENGKVPDTLLLSPQAPDKYEKDLKNKKLSPRIKKVEGLESGGAYAFLFDQPVIAVDKGKIYFITGRDTFALKGELRNDGPVISWVDTIKRTGSVQVFMKPGAVTSFSGISNDTIRYTFELKAREEYGTLFVSVEFKEEGKYFLQLVTEQGAIHPVSFDFAVQKDLATGIMKKDFKFARVNPGNYVLKINKDDNADKEWSPGDVLKGIRPEKVWIYDKSVKLLADWEMNIEWKLPD
jgi:hypothetical protein